MNAKIVRLTSVYCAGGRLIPSLVEGLLQNKLKQIGSGSNMKHITHVDDCVEGMMLAATKGTPGAIYNIGAKEVPTMGEIMEQVSSAIGRGRPVQFPQGLPGSLQQEWRPSPWSAASLRYSPAIRSIILPRTTFTILPAPPESWDS